MMSNFVLPEELSYFIESIRPFQLVDIGSTKWVDVHEMIIKLSQQAILEAAEHREEEVKEFLISRDKLKVHAIKAQHYLHISDFQVLIHEAYSIFLWKTRVLPHLLEIDPNPQATFLIYTVLFHEAAVISLLDTTLFHVSACEALQDAAIDLVDYCALAVAQVIGLVSMGYHENQSKVDVDEAVLSELERQKRDLIYKIGMRCISILSYLAEHADSIPLSASRRMVVTHDVPWLIADLLQFRPWQRRTNKGLQRYIDEKWLLVQGDDLNKVSKQEAQSWFCMRELLFNNSLMTSYELNEERRKHLSKCQGLLLETILDQLPPLVELKQYLCLLGVAGNGNENRKQKSNLLLEELPEIREKLIAECERIGGFPVVAQKQEEIFLCTDKDKICEIAKRLNTAYNTDLLAELEETAARAEKTSETVETGKDEAGRKKCGKCASNAVKKCANCKTTYYCSRSVI
ncbi:PREDICTED: zinc finger MYND domain-containing protein 10 homolog [Rhagoletis zephyria]|uniref:zinc finger MYND domain-containing protein 10 homolog n=1 Tax=Rhagoletis zephyria TaxID=28612 RepID=UPI0008117F6E|nr:PREDICTED: zinc finger MYND domain-containing protein 10 homolog [Rhagoletis zephyria]